jgi:transcriptional regulator with GAF, ATPase, and Fis domain
MELQPGTRFQLGNTVLRFDPLDREQQIPFTPGESFGRALGRSLRMREIFATLEKAAPSDVTVLLEGETGTGKELLASALHNYSLRSRRPFLVLDCAAVSSELVEDQIFGHQRGAFTGAEEPRAGIFEEATGGTVFLDEVGELPLELQPKLLRVIEEKAIRRLGGTKSVPLDVRLVAATNRDLILEVEKGSFREDLFFRLSVLPVRIPPLRERAEDIQPLAQHFLAEGNDLRRALGLGEVVFSADVEPALAEYFWPGNARELRNRIEQALSLAEGDQITAADVLGPAGARKPQRRTLERIEPIKQAKARVVHRIEKE